MKSEREIEEEAREILEQSAEVRVSPTLFISISNENDLNEIIEIIRKVYELRPFHTLEITMIWDLSDPVEQLKRKLLGD